jgi:hypothetical protein
MVASTAAVGLGLTASCIGQERGTVRTLESGWQGGRSLSRGDDCCRFQGSRASRLCLFGRYCPCYADHQSLAQTRLSEVQAHLRQFPRPG